MRDNPTVTRRGFLETTSMLALTCGPGGLPSLLAAESAVAYPIGCYTRPWDQHDYRVALDGIAEAGFKYAGIMTAKVKTWVWKLWSRRVRARLIFQKSWPGSRTAALCGDR